MWQWHWWSKRGQFGSDHNNQRQVQWHLHTHLNLTPINHQGTQVPSSTCHQCPPTRPEAHLQRSTLSLSGAMRIRKPPLYSLMCEVESYLTGKVLEDPMTLAASNLSNGSKLMLVASQGLYQGVLVIHFLLFLCWEY